MLGKAADHFMLAQMRQRIAAMTPNAGGRSLVVPDRERPGTAHVVTRGGYGMPGPQRTVSSGFVPGMAGPGDMMPGMGEQDMLPGMGEQDMLPGMGETPAPSNMLKYVGLAAAGLGIVMLLKSRRG